MPVFADAEGESESVPTQNQKPITNHPILETPPKGAGSHPPLSNNTLSSAASEYFEKLTNKVLAVFKSCNVSADGALDLRTQTTENPDKKIQIGPYKKGEIVMGSIPGSMTALLYLLKNAPASCDVKLAINLKLFLYQSKGMLEAELKRIEDQCKTAYAPKPPAPLSPRRGRSTFPTR